ncbi:MAG TPA: CHASE3 domain-containing protein, partial [Solirubrobacteraceae bacterium]
MALAAACSLLLGLALLILIGAVSGQRDAARTAFRSQQALSIVNELEKSLLGIENGLGRYVSTGNRGFLGPVRIALADYPMRTEDLARRLSDDPGQQQLVRQIGQAIDEYADVWVASLLDIARGDLAAAADQIKTNGGGSRVDAIRLKFARLSRRERVVINEREARAEARSERAI